MRVNVGVFVTAPRVLFPFDIREAMPIGEAAKVSGRSVVTVREWAARHDLGRLVGGRWMISRVALAMFLDDDPTALRAYHSGRHDDPTVRVYFARFGLNALKVEKERVSREGRERTAMVADSMTAHVVVMSDSHADHPAPDSFFRYGRYPDRITAHVPKGFRARLQSVADREGVSPAEMVRRLLARSLDDVAGRSAA